MIALTGSASDPARALLGTAYWWEPVGALSPVAALIAAGIAAWIGIRNIRVQTSAILQRAQADARALAQKTKADSRAEWWRRTQWALEASIGEESQLQKLGINMLAVLAESDLARPEDLKLLDSAWESSATGLNSNAVEGLLEDAPQQSRAGEKAVRQKPAPNVDGVLDSRDNGYHDRTRGEEP